MTPLRKPADNHIFIHRLRGFPQITDEGSCRSNTSIVTALLLGNPRQSAKSADNHFIQSLPLLSFRLGDCRFDPPLRIGLLNEGRPLACRGRVSLFEGIDHIRRRHILSPPAIMPANTSLGRRSIPKTRIALPHLVRKNAEPLCLGLHPDHPVSW